MPTPEEIDDALDANLATPASSTIEGNTVTNRSTGEILAAKQQLTADTEAAKPSGGIKRTQFRHRGPAGGPT